MKKRILASLLSLCLIVGLLPTAALAADESGTEGESPTVCTCTALCTEGSVDETCPVCAEDDTLCAYTAPAEPVEEPGDEPVEEPTEGPAGEPEGPVCAGLEGCDIDTHAEGCPLYVEPEEPTNEDKLIPSTESTAELLSGTVSSSTSQALEGAEGSDLTWELTEGTLTISGTGAMKDYGYSGRTEVPWYEHRTTITKVVFEAGVTHIGSFAFFQHTKLTSFEMADSVVSFGQGAFQGCSALTTIPKLHANFQDFSTEVFVDAKISAYEVDEANPYYTVKDGILYSEDGTTLINCPPGKEAVFDQSWLNGVTTIAPYAFRTCKNLTGNLIIPAHITSIGRQAFQNCSGLTGDLTVPNTVTDLDGYYAFAGLSGMKGKLTLGSNFTEIAGGMFNGGGFTSMEWQGTVTSVDNNAFTGCKFANFVLPDSLTTVGNYAFRNCVENGNAFGSLEHLSSIGTYAFGGCNLGSIYISSNAEVATNAFNGATITSVTYNAPTLTKQAFNGATVNTFTLMDNVTYIGAGNFTKTGSVSASLRLVQTIEASAFKGTTFTTDISIPAGATVGNNAFENATLKNVSYNAETASYAAFKGATMDSLTLGDSTTEIAANAFQTSTIGGDVLKLGKVETIEKYAFSEAQLPATVIVPETATYYNNHVFFNVKGGKTLLVYGAYNMVPTALTHGSSFETVVITADIVNNDNVQYGDGQKAHNRLTSMPEGHIIYMTNSASSANAEVPNRNGVVGVTNGGTFAEDTVFTSGTLATPTKDGAIFEGWYANADFTGEKVTTISDATTYFAKWIELTAKDIEMEYGSEKELSEIKINGVALTGWTSANSNVVKIEDDKLIATGVGETTITANAALATRSGEKLTVDVTVTPMPITFGTEQGENPGGTITYQFTGKAPEFSQFAKFYPAKVDGSTVSVVEGSEAVTLTEGTDIVFVYNAGAGEQEYEYLPINVTEDQDHGIEVTVKMINPNYRFVTSSNTALSETIKENVIVKAEGKTEVSIIGLPAVGENPSYAYTGKAIAPISNLTRMSAGTIDKFTVHFHPWGDTDFTEAHLTDKPTNELTPEAIASIAPKEPGSYLMIVDGTNDKEYVYQSWIFTITKATVTIRPNDKSAYVGDELPALGADDYTVTGLVGNDTLSTKPTLAYEDTPDMSKAGTYAIKAGSAAADAAHYELVYEDGTLTVSRRSSGGGGGGSSSGGDYTVSVDTNKHGTVTVSPKRADKGDTVTITVKPDKGYELDSLTVTDKSGDTVKLKDKGNGKFTFTMPGSKVTVEASFKQIDAESEAPVFADVPAGAWYADAVAWAVEQGVTTGTSATTFGPDVSCTRAQMVTFLWRANGSPKASGGNPFTDVNADAYYYDAVLWAAEQGITSGTTATTFSPDATVNRGQTVTFLWRNAGSPVASGSSFADVAADAYYASAVAWAAHEGITSGTSATTFSPNNACTRAQIVTFLWRELA